MNLQENIRRILREETTTEAKYLIYIYFCDYNDPRFIEFVSKFESMNIDFWVEPGKGHHKGFSIQSILNTHSLNKAKQTVENIFNEFDNDILIVLSKQKVTNIEPIGINSEDVFTEVGRYFDKLVKQKKKGIFFI